LASDNILKWYHPGWDLSESRQLGKMLFEPIAPSCCYEKREGGNKNKVYAQCRCQEAQIESIQQDLSDLKKIIRKIERDLGIR